MPLYEYKCETCGHRFEVLQRMGASSQGVSCPQCGGFEVKRLVSTFASSVSGSAPATSSASSCATGFS